MDCENQQASLTVGRTSAWQVGLLPNTVPHRLRLFQVVASPDKQSKVYRIAYTARTYPTTGKICSSSVQVEKGPPEEHTITGCIFGWCFFFIYSKKVSNFFVNVTEHKIAN